MCDKAVNDYPSTTQFVSECFKTQKICDKAVMIIFMNNIYTGNIKKFSAKKLYMETWYSSKFLWISSVFPVWRFALKLW